VTITTAHETPESGTGDQTERVLGDDASMDRASGSDRRGAGDNVMRRTGFGLLEETIPLKKRIQYDQSETENMG
jgi:hypothetical protein